MLMQVGVGLKPGTGVDTVVDWLDQELVDRVTRSVSWCVRWTWCW